MARLREATGKVGLFTDGDWILSQDMDPKGHIGVIQLKHIGIGEFLPKAFQFVTESTFERLRCTEVMTGDVLISRMADPIARACIVPRLPFRAVTAVDVSILRTDPSIAFAPFICFLCNSPSMKREVEVASRGTTRSRITRTELGNLDIPLPNVTEQEQVAAVLETADRLRRTRRYTRQLSDAFLQSVFLEMFGDVTRNPKGWDREKFSEIGKLDRGKSKHRPRNAPHLYGGEYPFIQTGDIANCANYIKQHQQTYSEQGLKQSRLWPAGTLCITIAANIPKTGILTYPACFPDSVVGFLTAERVTTEFIQYWLSFLQVVLERTAPESAQKNINLEILRELPVPVPPLPLQEEFARIVGRFERLRAQQREAERQAEHLFQTLLHRAFAGELVGVARSRSVKRKPSVPAKKRTYSPGVFYRRAAIEAYVINALRGDKYLGRTKLEKIDHLIEYHCDIDLERYPMRDAAGPDDYPSRMKLEHLADKRNWFSAHDNKDGSIVRYLPKRSFMNAANKGAEEIGAKRGAVDGLLVLMRPLDTKRCEIIATLYAAWNDFLLVGRNPSDDEIVHDVLNNWRPEKQLIPERRWLRGLKWMRDNGLVPRGRGKPVLKAV